MSVCKNTTAKKIPCFRHVTTLVGPLQSSRARLIDPRLC